MQIRGSCGGCFSGSPCFTTCPIAPCSVRHSNVQYCFECSEYPCKRYDGIDKHDSLISHRNQKKDLAKAREMGIEAYLEEQRSKRAVLDRLLDDYDEGDSMVFFCLAVNMLPLGELRTILGEADNNCGNMTLKEKSAYIEGKMRDCGSRLGIELELRPWQ